MIGAPRDRRRATETESGKRDGGSLSDICEEEFARAAIEFCKTDYKIGNYCLISN